MNVLITGGAGFVGSHLAERLLAWGDENIQYLKTVPGFHCLVDTITNHALMAELVPGARGQPQNCERLDRDLDHNNLPNGIAHRWRNTTLVSWSKFWKNRNQSGFIEDLVVS